VIAIGPRALVKEVDALGGQWRRTDEAGIQFVPQFQQGTGGARHARQATACCIAKAIRRA